ncbi:MAG: hypothetical protein Q9188_006072 [Gyalolechia gomerana]
MEELIRDTAFGHLVRLLLKGRVLQYAEDRDPSLWRQYLSEENPRSMAHHGDSDQLSDKERPAQSSEESSRTRAGSEQHFNPTGQPVDQEKGKNSNVVDWFDENDPEAPMSEIPMIGRNPVYIGTLIVFVIFQVPTALATNFAMLLCFRFLTGFIGSPVLATGGASIADMFAPNKRAYGIGIWGIAAVCGPVLGPLVGGFAVQAKDWSWTIWELMWLSGFCLIFLIFFLPETSSANILYRRSRRLRKLTGIDNLRSEGEIAGAQMTPKEIALIAIVRPITLNFQEPMVFLLNLYIALIYGLLYIWFESFPIVFTGIYKFNLGQEGLAFVGILVGAIVVIPPFFYYLHRYVEPQFNDRGELKPEIRLPPAMLGGFFIPICLFWFGWSARPSIHWIMPIIGSSYFAIGTFLLFQAVLNYLGDAYPDYAASVLAGNDFMRSSFGAGYAPRLRAYANSLLTPVIPQSTQLPPLSRTTKRGTTAINYAENDYDDDDIFEDDTGPKRLTGLRSRREDPNQTKESVPDKFGKELVAPVNVQGIWRDWMNKPKLVRTEKQLSAQSTLPLTLIPIRIDLDIPSFTPQPALPLPADPNVDPHQARYRAPEPTPAYRLKDIFLWNLHETLITPEQFALILVQDLDLPNAAALALQVSQQIRQQLEEYAGVALHPLFHSTSSTTNGGTVTKAIQASNPRDSSGAATPAANGANAHSESNGTISTLIGPSNHVSATASEPPTSNELNPDDTYRCIITLNINLQNKLFTDKFEWSLLHPPGMAERFAKQTCADIGLIGEWIPAVTHAIYEAVLRLKKEACESGGLVGIYGTYGIDNDAIPGQEAGWRYDNEHLADEWEPKVERLSKEEIEKREGDRERQIRRLRRETARFSSTTNMDRGLPLQPGQQSLQQQQGGGGGYFDQPVDSAETPMGRGERSKKKRRFRSLSPQGRSGTPGGRGTPDQNGYGGSGGGLAEWERQTWRCSHCAVHGSAVWAVRDGPSGARSLCNNCGLVYERDKRLPPWAKNLHSLDLPIGGHR